ncbi:TetR/AcrR family transcriptional regulator [Mycolicibacterium sp. 018/SC-01/001]|nr:TetR/AcrR family transcriptional regulator [Mycolicibacterium sp. 018/SC-01/001]
MTRRKISDVATRMFLENGFDEVTVAQVAKEAGVSSVTVFKHFPRKEDLLFDRVDDAVEILRGAMQDRDAGVAVLTSLRDRAFRLLDERHALSGVKDGSIPFYRTVAASPALIARAREIAAELTRALQQFLNDDADFTGDADLFATLVIAGYSTVLTETARQVIAEGSPDPVVDNHRQRLGRLFGALQNGLGQS